MPSRVPPTRTRPPAGLLAARFRPLGLLGAGGMGTVWRAVDQRTGTEVAVKLLAPHEAGSAALLRFVREQARRVDHPHVLSPTGWAATDDHVVLVAPLVRGGSVEDLVLEHGPLPTAYAAVLLDQLLQALAAVHGAGVVHRDVKPANLLLDATGRGRPRLRLADFGVALVDGEARLTRVPGPVGTDGYLPPAAADHDTAAQDLHAAGVVGVQLLTGGPPGTPVPPGPLAPLLSALVQPTACAGPSGRPSAEEALARLRALDLPHGPPWGRGEAVPDVRDRTHPAPARRPAASRGGARAAGLACLLVALGLLLAALALLLR